MNPPLLRPLSGRLPPGRPGDPGLFGPGSVAWRVNGEAVLILAGPRALLMQIAHPLVAAGVARHSDFPADAFERLGRTLEATLAISFGDTEQAHAAAASITAVHRRVAGRTSSGAAYSALDPDLLKWVWATLVDSALAAHRLLIGGLSEEEEGRYVAEMRALAVAMRTPARILPRGLKGFRAYVDRTLAGLVVSEEAVRLAPPILTPPLPPALLPLATIQRALTVGLLPEQLRRAYGLRWSGSRERAFGLATTTARAVVRATPAALRRLPQARQAERRAARGGGSRLVSTQTQPSPGA
jgi:uncharacterized protein (DUF2236 family)